MRARISLAVFVLLLVCGTVGLLASCLPTQADSTPTITMPAASPPMAIPTATPLPSPTVRPSPTPTLPPVPAQPTRTSPPTRTAPTPTRSPRDDVPGVSASFPISGDTGVPPDAPVTLVFNRPMDRASVEAVVAVVPSIPVTVTWAGDQRLTIASTAWLTGTTYTVTVTSAARTAAGEPLARPFAARFRAGNGKVPIPILMYHALIDLKPDANASLREWSNSPASFAAQMDYLDREGYNPIDFPALMDYLERNQPVPPKSVLITFDDGHRTFPTEALPVLAKHKFKATLFIVTDYPEGQYGAYMHWDALRAAVAAGVDIGSHSMSHKLLNRLTPAEAEHEIRDSKALIQERLGYDVTVFSYPSGAFNDTAVALVQKAGYRAAVTINPAPWQVRGDSYLLNRIHFPYDSTLADFARWLP